MKRFFKYISLFLIVVLILVAGAGTVLWYIWSSNLPYIGDLQEYNPPIITEIYSDTGEVIGRFWDEKRIVVPLEQVPKHLIQAFISAEDARFYKHEGVDIPSIIRAFFTNIIAGRIEQGGSTITQQVTKSLLLRNPEKTYKRKVREATLSLQIEKNFSKDRILFIYLNEIYLGHGAYGVESAAQTYFGKRSIDLNLAESALLAGLPQAPSRYSPILHFNLAKARQKYVLKRMHEEGYITEQEKEEALATHIPLYDAHENVFQKAPYFTEYVRKVIVERYGRDALYRGGVKVYTTLNLDMQSAAQKAIRKGLYELDKREGYRGPLDHLGENEIDAFIEGELQKYPYPSLSPDDRLKGVVLNVDDSRKEVTVQIGNALGVIPLSEMKWARPPDPEVAYYSQSLKKPSIILKKGDIVDVRIKEPDTEGRFDWKLALEQEPEVQGALFCIEPKTGEVKAMVGGWDFSKSQFNRAIQARRQPGSAFKPIIYAAALDWGMNPATVIIDAPYISKMENDEVWRPKNYKKRFFGPTLFRTALIKSRNVITIKILRKIGVPYAIDYARKMGIKSDLSPDLSLALGSSGLSLEELTRAYTAFANGGVQVAPVFIKRIEDRTGRIIEENQTITHTAIPQDTAYIMADLLKAVVSEGTGWRAKALKRPVAGKTGTTNNLRDAWFMGFTQNLVTGTWVGYDDRKSMGKGETGSRAASPIWLYFMKSVLEGGPIEDFNVPEGVVFAKIDSQTGLLASLYSKKTVFQAFKEGTEPKKYTPKPKTAKSGGFSQFDMDFGN